MFLGGTSVFGAAGPMVGAFVASCVIGAINAGIVSAGVNAFYTRLAFGLVIVISVVLQTIIDRRFRRQSVTGQSGPPTSGAPSATAPIGAARATARRRVRTARGRIATRLDPAARRPRG